MDITAEQDEPNEPEQIGGDRRDGRRYEIRLEMRWQLVRRRRVLDTGSGRTVDVSSSGILFDAGKQLPPGMHVDLSISWPVLLHNVAPLQLSVTGTIVRVEGNLTAIRMSQHEFRTLSVPAERRRPTPSGYPRQLADDPQGIAGLGKIQ